MIFKSLGLFFSSIFLLCTLSSSTQAWGSRGHFAICEVAVDFVQNEELKEFLKPRRMMMGHLCNIPDIYWKSLDYEFTSVGNPGHYLNPENIQKTLETLSVDFKSIAREMKVTPEQLNKILGSLWWRADQFYRLSLEAAKKIQTAPRDKKSHGKSKRKNKEAHAQFSPYISQIFQMMTYMGLLGHYVGDASMPYHSTANADGWMNGRGGIHNYYESQVVDEFEPQFLYNFFAQAQKIKLPEIKNSNNYVIERIRSLNILAHNEISEIEKADIVLKPSTKEEGEFQLKTRVSKYHKKPIYAHRPPAQEMMKKFEPFIINEMARSALAIAELWNRAYVDAGAPSLKGYEGYQFPFQPEFIWPDYLN